MSGKITIASNDGKNDTFIAPPAYVHACWNEVFGAFQQLGTPAMRIIEVVSTEPIDHTSAKIKVVISIREQRRESAFNANPGISGEILSGVIRTFWTLIGNINSALETNLQTLQGVKDFSKPICELCGGRMVGNIVGGASCTTCGGTEFAQSDWILEEIPLAKPVFGLPTTPPVAGSLVYVEGTARKTCPACGNDMELIQGKVLKCPNCFESMPGVPPT